MRQLSLFERDELDSIRVVVYPDGRGYFFATIAGGWWMAYGETVKKAVENVVIRFEGER